MATEAQRAATRLEKLAAEALKDITSKSGGYAHRYPDKKAAGRKGHANKAPSDFYLLTGGKFHTIECKASVVSEDFRKIFKKAIQDHQMTAARKHTKGGGNAWFLFASEKSQVVELWSYAQLVNAFYTPRLALTSRPYGRYAYNKHGVHQILVDMSL